MVAADIRRVKIARLLSIACLECRTYVRTTKNLGYLDLLQTYVHRIIFLLSGSGNLRMRVQGTDISRNS